MRAVGPAALHAYELLHQGLYDVRHLPVRVDGKRVRAMIYLLRRRSSSRLVRGPGRMRIDDRKGRGRPLGHDHPLEDGPPRPARPGHRKMDALVSAAPPPPHYRQGVALAVQRMVLLLTGAHAIFFLRAFDHRE